MHAILVLIRTTKKEILLFLFSPWVKLILIELNNDYNSFTTSNYKKQKNKTKHNSFTLNLKNDCPFQLLIIKYPV